MNCYLCRKSNLEIIKKQLRYNIQRNVLRCQDCGLVYLEPRRKDISEYYNKVYRKFHGPVLGKRSDPQEIFNDLERKLTIVLESKGLIKNQDFLIQIGLGKYNRDEYFKEE